MQDMKKKKNMSSQNNMLGPSWRKPSDISLSMGKLGKRRQRKNKNKRGKLAHKCMDGWMEMIAGKSVVGTSGAAIIAIDPRAPSQASRNRPQYPGNTCLLRDGKT